MQILRHKKTIVLNNKVGFFAIPDQIRDRSIEDGFNFNIMIIGRRGLGSKTLINSIFNAPLLQSDRPDTLTTILNEIVENSIKLKVTITTCHDLKNKEQITDYILDQFKNYLSEEKLVFNQIDDRRIHCCLFMIPNNKIEDYEFTLLIELSKICNVIPIIAKGDNYTESELMSFKNYLNTRLASATFYCPIKAVAASEDVYDNNGIQIRGRKYPWGFVAVEEILDFGEIQRMIVYENYEDFKDKTDTKFYQEFRSANIHTIDRTEIIRKLLKQMEKIMEHKYNRKMEIFQKEELDIEKFLSATKLTKNNSHNE